MNSRAFTKWLFVGGFVLGLIYAFGGLIIDLFTMGLNAGTAMAFGAIIVLPALFGASGIIFGLLFKLLLVIRHKIKGSTIKK